jgi:hypothetical protein
VAVNAAISYSKVERDEDDGDFDVQTHNDGPGTYMGVEN